MIRKLIPALFASLIVLCTTPPSQAQSAASAASAASEASEPAAASAAAAPAAEVAPAAASADAAKATVIFYRPSKFVGGAVGFIVREGTTELGKLRSGKYFILQVTPGKHTYVVHSEAKDELTIDADAGETYYIEGEIGVGVLVGHPHIKPSDQATFEAIKGKLTLVQPITG
jgi:hypothetical protein